VRDFSTRYGQPAGRADNIGTTYTELQATTMHTQIKNRRLYRRMQQIERLPRRDQDALLRTIEAFISKTA
jgi:hypothetical protein